MRTKVVFRKLEKSEFIESLVIEKLERVLEKFPEVEKCSGTVVVSMENSREHGGKDVFGVKLTMVGPQKKALVIHKQAQNPYEASAILADRLLDFLSRVNDKKRVLKRHSARNVKYKEKWNHSLEVDAA